MDRFEELVQEAIETIPDSLWNNIDNVYVTIEEWPTSYQLASVNLRHRSQLLGLYEGVPLTKRSSRYGLVPPDKITIFRQPILHYCRFGSDEIIRQQVRRTVIHEIAHHFGISDGRLRELGAY
ncbi:MAG: metallopeptidase family protein [Chloroflexota bacterium]